LSIGLIELGEYPKALKHLHVAERTHPDDIGINNNLGLALENLGRFAEAAIYYERVLQLKPDYTVARDNLTPVQAQISTGQR
jgi:Flp pilus assembly protein TadD